MYDTLFFLASVLGVLRVLISYQHPISQSSHGLRAPTINCTSIYVVRKCVRNSWCNLLYTFNAASHDDWDLHHLSEFESGELEHASDKS